MSFILCEYLQKYLINVEKKGGKGQKKYFLVEKVFSTPNIPKKSFLQL